jgi:hypothetical protein
MAPLPKSLSDLDGINRVLRPPRGLVSAHVKFAVMDAAERHCELVADLAPKRGWLGKPKMMRVGRLSPTHEARLRRDERPMVLVTLSPCLAESEVSTVGVWQWRVAAERGC